MTQSDAIQDVSKIMDKYPFTSEQTHLLLELQAAYEGKQLEQAFHLHSFLKKPQISWTEDNLCIQPFSDWIGLHEGIGFFECMAMLTGRIGSPSLELITVYQTAVTDEGETGHVSVLIRNLYNLALACHVVQHWGNVNLCTVQKLANTENKPMVSSLKTFNGGYTDTVDCNTFLDWAELNFPQAESILSSYIHLALFSFPQGNDTTADLKIRQVEAECTESYEKLSRYALGNRIMFQFPSFKQLVVASATDRYSLNKKKIVAEVKVESALIHNPVINQGGSIGHLAFNLATMDPKLCGKWHRLYSTETDGFAFLNLQRALTDYVGPTVILIRPAKVAMSTDGSDASPGLLGCYTGNPWKESNKYYGTSNCFLFRADPIVNTYRPRCFVEGWNFKSGRPKDPYPPSRLQENFMYFNPSTGHLNRGQGLYGNNQIEMSKLYGLVFGGNEKHPRLHITESLECCIASSGGPRDATFEGGPLLPGQWDKYFNVDVIEVWGIGGDDIVYDAFNLKERHDNLSDAARRRVQKVDKKQFLEDFQSGLHAGKNELFKHRFNQTR